MVAFEAPTGDSLTGRRWPVPYVWPMMANQDAQRADTPFCG